MSTTESINQLRAAVRGILNIASTAKTAERWIQALPESMHFEILGEIVVRFDDDSRHATFIIAKEHDDPTPELISVHWTPDPPKE